MYRNLFRFCFKYKARYADDITDVQRLKQLVDILAHIIAPYIQLDRTLFIQDMNKGRFAHNPAAHDTACHRYGFLCQFVVMIYDLPAKMCFWESCMGIRVHPIFTHLRQFFAPYGLLFAGILIHLAGQGFLIHAAHLLMLTIVYSTAPPGVVTSTLSPLLWPINACPTGDSLEIFPSSGLASVEPTMT